MDTVKTWKRAQKVCKTINLQYSIGCRYVGMRKQYMLKWEKKNNPKSEKGNLLLVENNEIAIWRNSFIKEKGYWLKADYLIESKNKRIKERCINEYH